VTTLTGTVERIVFRSDDERFVVARFRLEDVAGQRTYDDVTTLVGNLGGINPGEPLRVGGEWERHARHGPHFRVEWTEQRLPTTLQGLERFLGSGIIKGIGPGTARAVVERFGEQTIEIIEHHPERLREARIGRRAELIAEGWRSHRQIRELLIFLRGHDLPAHLAGRIRDQYGEECVSIIQRDPYRLARDVSGIGFKTADAMAVKLGLPKVSTSRFVSGLMHVLEEAAREGHVFLPKPELLTKTAALLEVSPDHLEPGLLEAARQAQVMVEDDRVYLTPLLNAERGLAKGLSRLLRSPSFLLDHQGPPVEDALTRIIAHLGMTLSEEQQNAVATALRAKVSIITGGPGTGKTTCLHALIGALEASGISYALCAPTGLAAKRIASATNRTASTIHRLLGYQPSGNEFAYNADHQLPADFVIVDEVSMLDILLANHLLKAVRSDAHLLLVGDADQLPSIGPGNILSDLLAAEGVPATILEELYRQARDSAITVAAHRIRRGQVPAPDEGRDLFLVKVESADRAREVVLRLVQERIPARFGLDPTRDVQVLSPTHRGPAGVSVLNHELQELLNPAHERNIELAFGRFRPGDKVMQVRNNYDKDVFNGDVGFVTATDRESGRLTVRFGSPGDERGVDYDDTELGDLTLAYAVSVHKAQGSEFPCVVLPMVSGHYPLLQRNLLYTALTRAKQLCVIVHDEKSLGMAVRSNRLAGRFTSLTQRLAQLDERASQSQELEILSA